MERFRRRSRISAPAALAVASFAFSPACAGHRVRPEDQTLNAVNTVKLVAEAVTDALAADSTTDKPCLAVYGRLNNNLSRDGGISWPYRNFIFSDGVRVEIILGDIENERRTIGAKIRIAAAKKDEGGSEISITTVCSEKNGRLNKP